MQPRGVKCLRTPDVGGGLRQLSAIHGTVPRELDGRLFRIGPGKFEDKRGSYPHWFDGEGLVTAVDFSGGQASILSRFVEPAHTPKAELSQRGRFGRAPEGAWRNIRSLFDPDLHVNAANTALVQWNGRLFALYEGGFPTEIDPDTLETKGETSLGVVARGFGAHPKVHPTSGAIVNQGFRSPWRPFLDYFLLGSASDARRLASVAFSGSLLNHDFAVTERYIISICCPLFPNAFQLLSGLKFTGKSLRWRSELGTELLITPINDASETHRFKTTAFLYSHTANAFEDGDTIVIHGSVAEDAGALDWLASIRCDAEALASSTTGRMTEIRVFPREGQISFQTLDDRAFDFPVIDPRRAGRKHTIIYGVGFRDETIAYRDLFDCLFKMDLERNTTEQVDFGDGHFVSEPVFVPEPDSISEDTGWLICLNYDAKADESYIAVIDARTMELRAIVPVGQALPMSFHGLWMDRRAGVCKPWR